MDIDEKAIFGSILHGHIIRAIMQLEPNRLKTKLIILLVGFAVLKKT